MTKGLGSGRYALLYAALAYGALMVWQARTLPERVPAHVGVFNEVDRWGSRTEHVLVASITGLVTVLVFWFIPALSRRMPPELVNLPHKQYWGRPENYPRALRMIGNDLGWFGAATLAFMGWMFWLVGRLAVDPSTPAAGFWVALVVYLAVTAVWVISLTVGGRWRPPATQE